MIRRFHGIDRHQNFSTISVLDLEGKEIGFKSICLNLRSYIDGLGPEDAVIMEASTGAFYWADLVEAKGALCFVLNPYRFKIIKDSWNKTDKPLGARRVAIDARQGTLRCPQGSHRCPPGVFIPAGVFVPAG